METHQINKKCCNKCKQIKDITEFYTTQLWCKVCQKKYVTEWRRKNPEKVQKYVERIDKLEARTYNTNYRRRIRIINPAKEIWRSAKWRAKKLNIPFEIQVSDIQIPTHCPILGIQLKFDNRGQGHADSPSLDKIDPRKGYIKGNIMVISNKANTMKNGWTLEELERVVEYMRKHLIPKKQTNNLTG